MEKQKARYTYGLTEKQFKNFVEKALSSMNEKPDEALFSILEQRLDNVVFRMGLAETRRMARQIVSHGHIQVNGKKMNIPSYIVKKDDTVSVRERSKEKGIFATLSERIENQTLPEWLTFDEKQYAGIVLGKPVLKPTETLFDLSAIIEFYNR